MIEKDGGCPTLILLPYTGTLVEQGFALSRFTRNSTKHFSQQTHNCYTMGADLVDSSILDLYQIAKMGQ